MQEFRSEYEKPDRSTADGATTRWKAVTIDLCSSSSSAESESETKVTQVRSSKPQYTSQRLEAPRPKKKVRFDDRPPRMRSATVKGDDDHEKRTCNEAFKSSRLADVILVQVPNHVETSKAQRSPTSVSSRKIKPEPRIEVIQTNSEPKKRKLVGPFILEDEEENEDNNNQKANEQRSFWPDNAGYGITSMDMPLKVRNDLYKTPIYYADAFPAPKNQYSDSKNGESTVKDNVELLHRRKLSEDKCAELSRKMREENLIKREQEVETSFGDDTSINGWFQRYTRDLSHPKKPQYAGGDVAEMNPPHEAKGSNATSKAVAAAEKQTHRQEKKKDYQLGGNANRSIPQDIIEAQLDLAHILTQADDDDGKISLFPNNSLMKRSSSLSPTSTWKLSGKEEEKGEDQADSVPYHTGSQLSGPKPPVLSASTRRQEKQPLSGKVDEIVTSGIDDCYMVPQNATTASTYDRTNQHDTSKGHVSAYMNGNRSDSNDALSIDRSTWTKDAKPPARKRDVQNLMDTLTETARCWWTAFDSMTANQQDLMKSNLSEVIEDYARPIFLGYSTQSGCGRRLVVIKHGMLKRVSRYLKVNPQSRRPTRQEIERTLVYLIGRESLVTVRNLLGEVERQLKTWKREQKERSSHRKQNTKSKGSSKHEKSTKGKDEALEVVDFGSDTNGPYQDCNMSKKQRIAWEREDDRIKQLKQALARYGKAGDTMQASQQAKKPGSVQGISMQKGDDVRDFESEESDEDQNETAPSFGRLKDTGCFAVQGNEPDATSALDGRQSFGGKVILSNIPHCDRELEDHAPAASKRPVPRKRLPTQSAPGQAQESPGFASAIKEEIEEELVSLQERRNLRKKPVTPLEDCLTEHKLWEEPRGFDSDAEQSSDDEDVVDTTYNGTHVIQYDILADYEKLPNFADAESVSLGSHVDAEAAKRHLSLVVQDVAGWASTRHRQTRVIWDVEDMELVSQTVILPTGSQCRIRMAKSRVPITDWPGRGKERQEELLRAVRPKVFYAIHEIKTTTTTTITTAPVIPANVNSGSDDRDGVQEKGGEEEGKEGSAKHEDSKAVKKEQAIYSSSRTCANTMAKNRLLAFTKRHDNHILNGNGTEEEDIDTYLEQLEHDKGCFDRQRTYEYTTKEQTTTETGTNKNEKKLVNVRIWVEELIADQPWD